MGNGVYTLSDRMKECYENRSKTYLTRKVPVIIRIDGKAFHTFTKGFKKPYDAVFHTAMNETAKYLCKNIQGCKMAYTQSDEISLLLTDFETPTTDAWFDYAVQKMTSISASMATFAFNKSFSGLICKIKEENIKNTEYLETLLRAREIGAFFDARCFSIPKEEVTNYFIWRQQDATRNAIQMLGQTYFTHKTLEGQNNDMIQDMLMTQRGINFNDMPSEFKRGVCIVKKQIPCTDRLCGYKTDWTVDREIPIFTKDRMYIETFLETDND